MLIFERNCLVFQEMFRLVKQWWFWLILINGCFFGIISLRRFFTIIKSINGTELFLYQLKIALSVFRFEHGVFGYLLDGGTEIILFKMGWKRSLVNFINLVLEFSYFFLSFFDGFFKGLVLLKPFLKIMSHLLDVLFCYFEQLLDLDFVYLLFLFELDF